MRVLRSEYLKQCLSAAKRGQVYDHQKIQNALYSILGDDNNSNAGNSGGADSAYDSRSFSDSCSFSNSQSSEQQPTKTLKFNNCTQASGSTDLLPLTFTGTKIQVFLHGINEATSQFNLEIKFSDALPSANYVKIYKSYEGQLWYRTQRSHRRRARWYFNCSICKNKLCSFYALRNHLNKHLNLYPFECDKCNMRYHALSSGRRHQQKHS